MSDSPEKGATVRGATVRVDYGLILLSSGTDGVTPSAKELEEINGLIVVTSGGAALVTGIDSGTVEVSVEQVSSEPAVDLGGWEEMIDVSIDVHAGDLRAVSVLGDVPELPPISAEGHPVYRARCIASGRGLDTGRIGVDSRERYRLISWPAPPAPPIEHCVLPSKFTC